MTLFRCKPTSTFSCSWHVWLLSFHCYRSLKQVNKWKVVLIYNQTSGLSQADISDVAKECNQTSEWTASVFTSNVAREPGYLSLKTKKRKYKTVRPRMNCALPYRVVWLFGHTCRSSSGGGHAEHTRDHACCSPQETAQMPEWRNSGARP